MIWIRRSRYPHHPFAEKNNGKNCNNCDRYCFYNFHISILEEKERNNNVNLFLSHAIAQISNCLPIDTRLKICYNRVMIITAGSDGSFKLQTGGITLMTEGAGSDKSRSKPDIFLRMARNDAETPEAGFTVKGAGEYEIQGVEIRGTEPFTYFLKAEDMRLVVLSSVGVKALEALTNIDIAIVPDGIAAEGIGRFLRQLEPKMIIAGPAVAEIIHKDLGLVIDRTEKVTIKRKDIPSTGMTLACITT